MEYFLTTLAIGVPLSSAALAAFACASVFVRTTVTWRVAGCVNCLALFLLQYEVTCSCVTFVVSLVSFSVIFCSISCVR